MVPDVSGVDAHTAVLGRDGLGAASGLMIGGLAQMGMIEVQAARFLVVIGRLMHVCRSGYEAEHQIDGTTAESEESTHPSESNRDHGSALRTARWTGSGRSRALDEHRWCRRQGSNLHGLAARGF